MALSENVSLSIEEALAQLGKLDRALAKSLRANVQIDILPALEDIKILRKTAEAALTKKYDLRLNTVEATRNLGKLETKLKAFRRLAEKDLQINLGGRSVVKNESAIARLTAAADAYDISARKAVGQADSFTAALEAQAIVARGLAADLRIVAKAQESFNRAGTVRANSPTSLLSGKDLLKVNRSLDEYQAKVKAALNPDISVPQSKLLTINRNLARMGQTADENKSKFSNSLRTLGKETDSLNQQLIGAGRSLSLLFTLPAVVAAGFAAFNEFKFQETIQRTKVLTDAFTKFDETGRRVNQTSEETTARIGALRDVFSSIATQTGTSPNDVADGFYFVASAGGIAATRLSILRVAAQGAAIGLGDVATIADTLTSVLNAYGEANITAASAGDILVRAVNDAKVEASDFAPQLGRILPIAAELGINFGQVAESLALLTQNGNTASVASTQLRGILQTLIRPTSEKAAEILASVGLSTAQLREQVSRKSPTAFIDTLVRLRKALPIQEFSQLFRRVDALNGALTLTNNIDAAEGFRGIADAAKNTSGNLEEFERFADRNTALKIKQAFSQLLVQLQPLGQTVLPLVAKGVGSVVSVIDKLGRLLKVPVLGQFVLAMGAAAVAAGPLIFSIGKIRQALQALNKLKTVLGVEGGFRRFLGGESVSAIATGAEQASTKVGLLGKAFGALPGLIGLGAAGALAFFSGTALASDSLKTKVLGVIGTLGSMALAFYAARAAAVAFGISSSIALGGIGVIAALIVGGIAAFSAYEEATTRSAKALEEFKGSLEGLTANEAIQNFSASLTKSLEAITKDDRITRLEVPEIQKALSDLGLTYEEVGAKIANIVIANPNDLTKQRNALRGLAEQISANVGGNRGSDLESKLAGINKQIVDFRDNQEGGALLTLDGVLISSKNVDILVEEIASVADVSDAAQESLVTLGKKGLLEVKDGILAIPVGKLDEAKAALGNSFGPDTLNLLDNFAEAFRRARKTALDTTGEFTLATNAAGSFVETLQEDGVTTVTTFEESARSAADGVISLTAALNDAVKAVFGLRDQTFVGEASDQLADNAAKRLEEITKAKDAFITKGKGKNATTEANPDFINFKVDIQGADGRPVRQFLRKQVDDIDSVIAPLLSGPDANIQLGLDIRDLNIQQLADQIGVSVTDINAFLAQDNGGLTTVQLKAQLDARNADQIVADLATIQTLIKQSPLSVEVKTQVTNDETGALFGSKLLERGLTDGKIVVDFLVNAIETGTPLETLQGIFADAPVDVTKNFIINAIEQGVPLDKISEAIAGIPDTIRKQLIIETPQFNTADTDLGDKILGRLQKENQFKINTIIEGAQDFENLKSDAAAGKEFPVTTTVDPTEFDSLVNEIVAGNTYLIRPEVDPGALARARAVIIANLGSLGLTPGTVNRSRPGSVGFERSAAGGVFGGGGFRRFRDGGTAVPGFGVPREPMIGRAPSNRTGILWGEPETHGEAYIPYNPARRIRAEALVRRVAKDFGMQVTERNKAHTRRNGASMPGEQVMARDSQREVARLAGEVARLSAVIEQREVQPLIGEYHAETPTRDPRATARYLATDILKAIR